MVADSPKNILDDVDGEIALFKALAIARPVGQHRHFHLLAIQNSIYNDTGRTVSAKDVLSKLETCYNLESLEAIVSFLRKHRRQKARWLNIIARNKRQKLTMDLDQGKSLQEHPRQARICIFTPISEMNTLYLTKRPTRP